MSASFSFFYRHITSLLVLLNFPHGGLFLLVFMIFYDRFIFSRCWFPWETSIIRVEDASLQHCFTVASRVVVTSPFCTSFYVNFCLKLLCQADKINLALELSFLNIKNLMFCLPLQDPFFPEDKQNPWKSLVSRRVLFSLGYCS